MHIHTLTVITILLATTEVFPLMSEIKQLHSSPVICNILSEILANSQRDKKSYLYWKG